MMDRMGGGVVYTQTNEPANAVIAFRRDEHGALDRIGTFASGGAGDAKPHLTSQGSVTLTGDRRHLLVTNASSDDLSLFSLREDGSLELLHTAPAGPTPYGFAITGGGTLVVTEAFRAQKGAAAASSYRIDGGEVRLVTSSVGNGRSEICWAAITPDDRFAFTTNFADGAVSRYAI